MAKLLGAGLRSRFVARWSSYLPRLLPLWAAIIIALAHQTIRGVKVLDHGCLLPMQQPRPPSAGIAELSTQLSRCLVAINQPAFSRDRPSSTHRRRSAFYKAVVHAGCLGGRAEAP